MQKNEILANHSLITSSYKNAIKGTLTALFATLGWFILPFMTIPIFIVTLGHIDFATYSFNIVERYFSGENVYSIDWKTVFVGQGIITIRFQNIFKSIFFVIISLPLIAVFLTCLAISGVLWLLSFGHIIIYKLVIRVIGNKIVGGYYHKFISEMF